jgi:ubiquilin
MSDDTINIKVKMTSTNTTYEITISKSSTVSDLKKQISEKCQLEESQQNLVYKGRILADEKALSDYDIQNDHTIILVKKYKESNEQKTESKVTTTSTTNAPSDQNDPFNMLGGGNLGAFGNLGGGLGGLNVDQNQLNSMLNNPMYMNMMNQMLSDPNTLNQVLNNPQIKPLVDANPQLRSMLSNPQMLQMMMNPQMLQNAMSMMGGGSTGSGSGTNTSPYNMGGSNLFSGLSNM